MSEATVGLTERAASRITKILASEPEGTVLRISVEGGGCSGFQYKFDLVQDSPTDDDIIIRRNEATVLVDSLSAQYMQGSQIDFVDDLIGQSFKIENPNAVASCGCGTSFAL